MSYHLRIVQNIENNICEEKVSAVKDWVQQMKKICVTMIKWWQVTVKVQVKYFDKNHVQKSYNVDDLMLLFIKNLKQHRLSKKLLHKFIESFQIVNLVDKQAYWLVLPAHYRIYNVFYVSYLKSHKCCLNNNSLPELLFLNLINDKKEYKIEDILSKKWRREQLQYEVKWIEYLTEYNEWL